MSDKQMKDLLEEGKFFLACDAMKQGEDELQWKSLTNLIWLRHLTIRHR